MILSYVPYQEIKRLLAIDFDRVLKAKILADICRVNILYMISHSGSGHIGSSASCIDMVTWLYLYEVDENQRLFSSKGHDAPAFYSALLALGKIDFELIHKFRSIGGLPGHPDIFATPVLHTNTGSLGMGISKAKGFALADRLKSQGNTTYVLTGDGELQEGQIWESLISASNNNLSNIIVIVDHNKIQSDTWVDHVSCLSSIEAKFRAFNWITFNCNGNDVYDFSKTLNRAKFSSNEYPKVIISSTVKGSGFFGMEGYSLPDKPDSLYAFHSGAPSELSYQRAFDSTFQRLTLNLESVNETVTVENRTVQKNRNTERASINLIKVYENVLNDYASENKRIVALDADLVLDTGLVKFRENFPERFIECGIAEQDMVSQAGTLALAGFIPIVHSFASFLTSRANEQIYNNATEQTKIVYVGSLAGLLPAGPGHSHQALRDISLLKSIPGMKIVEPTNERQLKELFAWSVQEVDGPVYMRLVSIPISQAFNDIPLPEYGQGSAIFPPTNKFDVTIITSGPITLKQILDSTIILERYSIRCNVVSLPWVSNIDRDWLESTVKEKPVISVDNHSIIGGIGDTLLAAMSSNRQSNPVLKLGLHDIPACGKNDQVLEQHRFDPLSLSQQVRDFLKEV